MSNNLAPYLTAIEEELHRIVSAPSDDLRPFYNMMAYHLGWLDQQFRQVKAYSGKRLRPLLCLLSCEAAGGDWRSALPAATALELVHNFSLIHDDIEDNSPTRRGRPALWKVWGLHHGINTGDGMLMLARSALARLGDYNVDTATILAASNILDHACLLLCQGQYLDMTYESRLDITEEAYLRMISAKTATLIAASTHLGALIARAEDDKIEHYRQFGWYLGLTFQMVDDLLGIWGDPKVTGKPVASDIRSRKMTLPIIFALGTADVGKELAALYKKEHLSDADVSRAVALLNQVHARRYVQERSAQYEENALAALDAARPCQPAAQYLRTLTTSLTSRKK